ncbi:MAG: IS200/IS605 family transposase [bacterium]
MRIRSLNHSVYQVQYHIVWGTRFRRRYLKEYVAPEFISSLYKTIEKDPTLYVHSVSANEDHVHLQIEIPPSMPIATVVQHIKADSSAHLKRKFKFIREMYIDGSIWSVGYFVSTIGLNEQMIERYIANQGRKDRGTTLSFGF